MIILLGRTSYTKDYDAINCSECTNRRRRFQYFNPTGHFPVSRVHRRMLRSTSTRVTPESINTMIRVINNVTTQILRMAVNYVGNDHLITPSNLGLALRGGRWNTLVQNVHLHGEFNENDDDDDVWSDHDQ